MDSVRIDELRRTIREQHGCESTWASFGFVALSSQGKTLWRGQVQTFDLVGHAAATRAHAWSELDTEGHRIYFAVLEQGRVTDAGSAVRSTLA